MQRNMMKRILAACALASAAAIPLVAQTTPAPALSAVQAHLRATSSMTADFVQPTATVSG